MTTIERIPQPASHELRHTLRVLSVVSRAEFKLKYEGSYLGYLWSVLKPLALFTVLYLVFGRIFKLGVADPYYPLSLLIGIVFYGFFSDGTLLAMWSLVTREALLRKLLFPRAIIPAAATITAALTFLVNLVVIAGFVAWNDLVPTPAWLLIPFLLVELYAWVLAVSLLLSVLFVRFRDLSQVWELALQLIFYASPIIYPIGYLPPWAREIAFLNPFSQILQDVRAILLSGTNSEVVTVASVWGNVGRLLPVAIVIVSLAFSWWIFRREEPTLAERV
jgi:ABC-2 type transport system permease protein